MRQGEIDVGGKGFAERLWYLDILRIVCIFCVMIIHVCAVDWYYLPPEIPKWQALNVYYGTTRFCVPVLFMISGALFLDEKRELSLKKLYGKNILRIITAFVFWSGCYAVLLNLDRYRTVNRDVAKKMLYDFFHGRYHLWFLFTLVFLYMVTPFLREICKNKRSEKYFLLLSFLFGSCLNTFQYFSSSYAEFMAFLGKMNFQFVLGYTMYFVLGHYLATYTLPRWLQGLVYFLGAAGVVFTIVGTSVWSVSTGQTNETLHKYLLPNVYFAAAAVFLFCKNVVSKRAIPGGVKRVVLRVSQLSFGMYLVHDFVIVLYAKLGVSTASFNAVLSAPILAAGVFFVSLLVSWMVSKIPVLNKYII